MSFQSGPSPCAHDPDRTTHGRYPEDRYTMTIVITAFERSPDGGQGLARDTRVRWALEEVGQPYEVRLVSFRAKKEPAHLRLHPFGLIPTYEEGELALFETGAIVLHLADHHAGLFPDDANSRARAITWMFAALNTVEPPILELAMAKFAEGDKPWTEERLPLVKDRIRGRLIQLSDRLGDADWLDGAFSAGDLMMASVLLRLRASGLLDEFRTWLPTSPAAKRGPRTSGRSLLNGRSTAPLRKPGDEARTRPRGARRQQPPSSAPSPNFSTATRSPGTEVMRDSAPM
jgi:glutathione S-transferase